MFTVGNPNALSQDRAQNRSRLGFPVDPRRLLVALQKAGRPILLATVAGTFAGLILAGKIAPLKYTAVTAMVWEPSQSDARDPVIMARQRETLTASIKLPANLDQVRRRLNLNSTPLDRLAARFDIESEETSDLVRVRATATDPTASMRMADTIAKVFLQFGTRIERARLDDQVRALTANITQAQASLVSAQQEYDEFRTANHIADLPAETQSAIEEAARLRSEAERAQAEAEAETARITALRAASRTAPTTVVASQAQNPVAARLAEVTAELESARVRLADDHPRVVALRAQADALRVRSRDPSVAAGQRTMARNPEWDQIHQGITGSLAHREAAMRLHATYENLANQKRQDVERLSAAGARASELLANVHAAEARLAERESERARAADAARSATSGFRIVAPALHAERAGRSLRPFIALGAGLFSFLVAVGLCLAKALKGLKVCTASEFAYWGGGPVVAMSTWPNDPKALDDLIADLSEFAWYSPGTTLVVAAGDADGQRTDALALCLDGTNPQGSGEAPANANTPKVPQNIQAWDGSFSGPDLRRAARWADRVLLVVAAGRHSMLEVAKFRERLGREDGVGFVLVNVDNDHASLPDRVGNVKAFWSGLNSAHPTLASAPEALQLAARNVHQSGEIQ